MEIKAGQIYKHFKGFEVRVICIAKHSETLEDYVVYDHMGTNELAENWVRPLHMFLETIERDGKTFPRFTFVSDN